MFHYFDYSYSVLRNLYYRCTYTTLNYTDFTVTFPIYQHVMNSFKPVFGIRDILIWIRMRSFYAFSLLKMHLHHSSKIKIKRHKEVTKHWKSMFFFISLLVDGRIRIGIRTINYVSGCGSRRRLKNIRRMRIWIPNTILNYSSLHLESIFFMHRFRLNSLNTPVDLCLFLTVCQLIASCVHVYVYKFFMNRGILDRPRF